MATSLPSGQSPDTETLVASGAFNRKVTRPSGRTSGETTLAAGEAGPRPPAPA